MDREEKEAPPGGIAREGMMFVIEDQQRRIALLQTYVDAQGEKWLATLAIVSADEAASAVSTYNSDWFERQPYSQDLKCRIALSLIESMRAFPFVDTSYWARVAGDNQ